MGERLRIALVSPSFLPDVGGAEFVVHNLALAWGRQGHEVRVLNWVTDEATHPDATYSVARFTLLRGAPRVGYHRFPFGRYTVRQIDRLLADFEPDFISAHQGYPTGTYMAKCRPRRPYVVTCHGRDLTHFDWGYRNEYGIDAPMLRAFEASEGVIAISRFAHDRLEEIGLSNDKIHDIPNGVDLERFRRKVDFDLRALLGLDAGARVVLSVGREHPQKDFATGIEAFRQVAGRVDDSHYLILGKGTGAHRERVAAAGLAGRVHLHEGLTGDDLVGAYQQADVYFSPSVWEMMPLVVLESMAAGIPAVVTDVSGSQDLIVPDETGYIVAPGDPTAMADRLVEVLTQPELRERLARATAERADDYSWDAISRRYLELARPPA